MAKMQSVNLEFSPTPPDSPESIGDVSLLVDDFSGADLPCFDCRKQRLFAGIFHPSPNGYLVDGVAARILEEVDPSQNVFTSDLILMFGHHYITKTALMEKLNHLFSVARQKIIQVEKMMEQTQNWIVDDKTIKEVAVIHREVLVFLRYVAVYIHRHLELSHDSSQLQPQDHAYQYQSQFYEEVARNLVSHLQELLLFIDRLSNFSSTQLFQYATSTSSQTFLTHFSFHVKMDLHWTVLMVLYCLHGKLSGSKLEESVHIFLNQEIRDILEDLVFLASIRLKKFFHEIHSISLFPCSCLQEMWCLMMHMINARNSKSNELSFWNHLQIVLVTLMEKQVHFSDNKDDHITEEVCKENNASLLSLWLVEQLVPLCKISCYGNIQEVNTSTVAQWSLLQLVMRAACSNKDNPPDEVALQRYLRIILSASSSLGASTKVLIYLWDLSSKRINEKQKFSVVGFRSSSDASKSARRWYDSCKQRCENNKTSLAQDDSFNLFVRILVLQLSSLGEQERQQRWKQLQGRLFLTLRGSFLSRLNEEGLTRILTLFLSLMMVQGVNDLLHCIMEVLEKVSTSSPNFKIISSRGLFAISLAQQAASSDISPIADKLVQDFNRNCSLFKQGNLDSKDRPKLWSKICNYVVDAQDVIEGSKWLSLSEDKLIGQGFSFILPCCSDAELPRMLTFINTVIQHFRNISNKQLKDGSVQIPDTDLLQKRHSAMAKSLWTNIYPFVEACSLRHTAPPLVVDLAVSFTQLAIDMEPKSIEGNVTHPKAVNLFEYYGLGNRGVHHSISSGYLCRLLPDPAVTAYLNEQIGMRWQLRVVKTWLRCSMSQPGSSNQLQELTSLVFKHPQMADILKCSTQDRFGREPREVNQPLSLLDFIKACSAYVSPSGSMEVSLQRKQTLNLIFGDLTTTAKRLMKGQSSKSSCLWIYEVISQIFKYCATSIYSQIPGLLTELVLFPSLYNPQKPIPPLQLQALRENLPGFMEGLASLNLNKDPLMKEKLHDIVIRYFPRFQETTPPVMVGTTHVMLSHPFEKVLYRSCAKEPSENLIILRHYVTKFLVEGYMPVPVKDTNNSNSNLVMVTRFFVDLLQKTLSEKQICRDAVTLLRPVLHHMLPSDQINKGRISPILTLLMQAARKCFASGFNQIELRDCFREFISRFISYRHGAIFKVLEIAAIQHPALFEPLLADCTSWVEDCPQHDPTRKAYASFLRRLGSTGSNELAKVNKQ